MRKLKAGILGATGAVGQRFIQLLEHHPWFEVTALCASAASSGQTYAQAVTWRLPTPMPDNVKTLKVRPCEPSFEADLVFSALPSSAARTVEPLFAAAGFPVISNASAFRMVEDAPLVIPEINPDHTGLIAVQQKNRGWPGFIVTNPNCSTIGLALPLKALDQAFGLKKIFVVTMQAVSGAGYPGPSLETIGDNVLPFIGGEEEKIESEPKKLLGRWDGRAIQPADLTISAQANRVHVSDGHLEVVSFSLAQKTSAEELTRVLTAFEGAPQKENFPSAPKPVIVVRSESDRPQPKLDRDEGRGMAVSVGRIRSCPILDFRMLVLSHNTIRGAAGAAILNAELLAHQGYLS